MDTVENVIQVTYGLLKRVDTRLVRVERRFQSLDQQLITLCADINCMRREQILTNTSIARKQDDLECIQKQLELRDD